MTYSASHVVDWLAAVAIGGYIWMASWQACIAINLWLSVVVQVRTDPACRECHQID